MRHHREIAHRGIIHAQPPGDKGRQPRQQHIEPPVAAKMGDDHGPDRHIGHQRAPGRRYRRSVGNGTGCDQLQLGLADPGLLARSGSNEKIPDSTPDKTDAAKQVEYPFPAPCRDNSRRCEQRKYGTERDAAVGKAGRTRPFPDRYPAGIECVNGRKGYCFAHPHQDSRDDQRRDAERRSRRRNQREQRPDQHPETEHHLAAIMIGQLAAHHLGQQIADEETGQYQTLGGQIPAIGFDHRNDCDRDRDPVHIADENGHEGHECQLVAFLHRHPLSPGAPCLA